MSTPFESLANMALVVMAELADVRGGIVNLVSGTWTREANESGMMAVHWLEANGHHVPGNVLRWPVTITK